MTEQINLESTTDFILRKRSTPWLHRTIVITRESAFEAVLAVVTVLSRLIMLGARVMSHDESLHVYYSWLLSTGKGFAHNPMMHGPLLFISTALMDWLFGASDFTSRLVPVVLGTIIVIAVPHWLKPWLGRLGALVASVLLLISPFISYFSRYIRHDIIVITWVLLAILAIFRYLADRRERDLILLSASLALMLSTMEISFIYMAIMVGFLLITGIAKYRNSWLAWRSSPEFDLMIVFTTLGALFSSPIVLLFLNPIWNRIAGVPFVDLRVLDTQNVAWATGPTGIHLWGLFVLFSIAAAVIGLWWNRERWPKLAVTFFAITIPLFTTFFTNLAGIGTGFIGSLGYWLSQQAVARGSQPWYYYLIIFPLYEYLPFMGGISAAIVFVIRRKSLPVIQRPFVAFLIWWGLWIFIALSVAGEKMPWLSTHIAIPFILLTGWGIGQLIEGVLAPQDRSARWRIFSQSFGLSGITLLVIMTARTSIAVNYVNYDYTTEFIDYAHGAPGVKWALNDIEAIANHTGAGPTLKVAYDDQVSWPMTWYLRDYPNQAFYGTEPNRQALDAPVVMAGPKNWNKVEAILGKQYHRFELIRLWWPLEDYKNLTWDRILNVITEPAMRVALWDIFWNRDYRKYAELTGESLNPPVQWPLEESMRVYVRKDIALQMLGMDLGPTMLQDVPEPVDAYAAVQRSEAPDQVITNLGLNNPRGLAVAPDRSIYVADTGNSRIVHLDENGNILNTWGGRTREAQVPPAPGTFVEPWGVAVDSQGNVYVADTWNHRIQKFDGEGKFIKSWGGLGEPSPEHPEYFWGPRGIAIGPQDRVYVTDTGNKRVAVFDTEGNFLQDFNKVGDGQLDEPVGIALGPNGLIYVADTWNLQVVAFSGAGNVVTKWPIQGWAGDSLDNKPYLAVDAAGRVYATDPERYRVIVFSATGTPLVTFGSYGSEPEAFELPVGLGTSEDETLWVVDSGNNRIAKFNLWK